MSSPKASVPPTRPCVPLGTAPGSLRGYMVGWIPGVPSESGTEYISEKDSALLSTTRVDMEILELPREATVDDLYEVDRKAELIDGEIVLTGPTGFLPSRASGAIYRALYEHERTVGGGYAMPDNAGFIVDLPRRKSFSPDAAWYSGEPTGGQFLRGAPALAVEVRSEGDYGVRAEHELMAKRADYFAAGTLVVWDVDVLRAREIRVYRREAPETPAIYRRGDTAEAEPAVAGWAFPVDALWE